MGVSKLQGIGTLRSAQKYRYPVLALSDGDLPDTIHQRVDREQGTTDDYANEASHDNHEDRLNHGRNIVDQLDFYTSIIFQSGVGKDKSGEFSYAARRTKRSISCGLLSWNQQMCMPRNAMAGLSDIFVRGTIHPSVFSVPRFGIAICRRE